MAVHGTPSSSDSKRIRFKATIISESCAEKNDIDPGDITNQIKAAFVVRKMQLCVCF